MRKSIVTKFKESQIFILAAGVLLLLSMFLDQGLCVVKWFYGIPCPACGMTRATISLIRMDIKQAFAYHPLVLLPPIIFIGILFQKLSSKLCIVIAVLFVGVWLIRMVLLFPGQVTPMEFNETAILPTILRWVVSWFYRIIV